MNRSPPPPAQEQGSTWVPLIHGPALVYTGHTGLGPLPRSPGQICAVLRAPGYWDSNPLSTSGPSGLFLTGEKSVQLVMEYVPLGSLRDYLPRHSVGLAQLLLFAQQICEVGWRMALLLLVLKGSIPVPALALGLDSFHFVSRLPAIPPEASPLITSFLMNPPTFWLFPLPPPPPQFSLPCLA